MENSSRSQILQDSPIVFPSNGFWWVGTIGFLLAILVVFLALVFAGTIGYLVADHLDLASATHALAGMAGVTIQSIAEVVIILLIVALLPSVSKTSLAGLGFRRLTSANFVVIILGAVLMFVLVTPIASALQTLLHFKQPEEAIALFTKTAGWQRVAFAFFGIVLAPLFEEAVFRWVLFNAMRQWWGLWPAAIVSSIFFGLAHAQPPFTGAMLACISLPLAFGGVILCMVYARTNNAWASCITHAGFNALSIFLLLLFPQLAK